MPKGCRICQFWERYPYRVSERELFEKKAREGVSLRKLELLLEAYGLKAKKDLISKHIKVCMNLEVSEQRQIEKQIKKEKTGISKITEKISKFFIKPEVVIPERQECLHLITTKIWNFEKEGVDEFCTQCGEHLGFYEVEDGRPRRDSDIVLWGALRK